MLKQPQVVWGSDPEAFFQREGQIIGSERLIPERGFAVRGNKIIRDGVQFEMNPAASQTIEGLGYNVGQLFAQLKRHLKKNPDITCCFDGLVEVSQPELDGLSPATRVLGCMPSHNFYGSKAIDVDPLLYRKRSSGGHIHMGLSYPIYTLGGVSDYRSRLVPLCDIFVGNSCVLLDRDPGAAERRENYGRAGEYRLPQHGLEYRTTSNFWLRDFSLMSFTFGMAAVAISVLNDTLRGQDLEQQLVNVVDIEQVARAINTNDFDLALLNFRAIQPFLATHLPPTGFPLSPNTLDKFISFATDVRHNSIATYFPTDNIVNNWQSGVFNSFELLLSKV